MIRASLFLRDTCAEAMQAYGYMACTTLNKVLRTASRHLNLSVFFIQICILSNAQARPDVTSIVSLFEMLEISRVPHLYIPYIYIYLLI